MFSIKPWNSPAGLPASRPLGAIGLDLWRPWERIPKSWVSMFPWRYPSSWLVYFRDNPILEMDDDWGGPAFQEPSDFIEFLKRITASHVEMVQNTVPK